jgi:predicted DCC family thiol-disulfide oxidoreductase YuxK
MVTATLLVDGDCGLCVASGAWLAARVPGDRVRVMELQDVAGDPRLAALTAGRDLGAAVHLVGADDTVRAGAAAVLGAARHVPGWGTAASVYDHPAGHALWEPAYRLVARNRRRIGRRLGLAEVCRI